MEGSSECRSIAAEGMIHHLQEMYLPARIYTGQRNMRVFTLLHAQHCLGICTMSAAQQTVTQALHCIVIGLNHAGAASSEDATAS